MAKHNKTGRSKGEGRFAGIPHSVMNSTGYLQTRPAARAVLLELARLYNGVNNGMIGLSVRTASDRCNISKDTVSKAFQELEDCGLIEAVEKGTYRIKTCKATEWRLLWARCNVAGLTPSRRFLEM